MFPIKITKQAKERVEQKLIPNYLTPKTMIIQASVSQIKGATKTVHSTELINGTREIMALNNMEPSNGKV